MVKITDDRQNVVETLKKSFHYSEFERDRCGVFYNAVFYNAVLA
jgi:hypothetical protein